MNCKKKREREREKWKMKPGTVGGTLVLSSWKCLKPRGLSVLTKRTFGEKKERKRESERERKSSGVSVHDKIEFSAMVTSSTEHATGPIQIYTPESWPRNTMSFCAALHADKSRENLLARKVNFKSCARVRKEPSFGIEFKFGGGSEVKMILKLCNFCIIVYNSVWVLMERGWKEYERKKEVWKVITI